MDARQARLRAEELGERISPAFSFRPIFPLAPGSPVVIHHHHVTTHHRAAGTGDFSVLGVGDHNRTLYQLSGNLNFGKIGTFDVSGTLHSVGHVRLGHAGGHLVLSNSQGTIVLRMVGHEQHADRPLPESFHYQVVGATGAYHHLSGHGSADLVLGSSGSYSLNLA